MSKASIGKPVATISFLSAGLFCIIAAIVGGGLEAPGGWKFPDLPSLRRESLLALLGFILVEASSLPTIVKSLQSGTPRTKLVYYCLCILMIASTLVASGLVMWVFRPPATQIVPVPATAWGSPLFLNSTVQQKPKPIPNWKWKTVDNIDVGTRTYAWIRSLLTTPPDWTTGRYMTVRHGESAWFIGALPDTISTVEFQIDLHKDQSSVSWVVAPSKDLISRIEFSPTTFGVNGPESFTPNGSPIADNLLAIPPALEGERLTVWLKIEGDQADCHLQYTFQATQPDSLRPPKDPERGIYDSLGDINRGGMCQSIPPTTLKVSADFCTAKKLNIGFEAPDSASELQIAGVTVNTNATCN